MALTRRMFTPGHSTVFAGDYLSQPVGWQEGAALSAHRAIARITDGMRT